MSEEIIINGVNVAECEYYEDTHECPDNLNGGYYIQHCYCSLQGDNYCICNNCYYKQLKRLKQENEKLKKRQITKNGFICDCEQNAKYKQALEEINEILKQCRYYANFFGLNKCSERCKFYNDCNGELSVIEMKLHEVLND